ncbi:MAG: DUF2306 domain-containing protein [Dokdonella sp.]
MARPHVEVASSDRLAGLRRAARTIVWLLLVAAVIFFLRMTYQKYGHIDAGVYGIFWPRRGWLWTHLAGGVVTLALGPFQFIARLRAAYPRIHRWTGRTYLMAMCVASVGAVGLIATTPGGIALQVEFSATGIAWLFTASMGFIAIRRKLPQVHRRWMVRNYIITLAFVTFRAVIMIPGVMQIAAPSVLIPALLWSSWLVPLLLYQAGLAMIHWARRSRTGHLETAGALR